MDTITQRGTRGPVVLDIPNATVLVSRARTPGGDETTVTVPLGEVYAIQVRESKKMLRPSSALMHTVTGQLYEWSSFEPIPPFATLINVLADLLRRQESATVYQSFLSDNVDQLRDFFGRGE